MIATVRWALRAVLAVALIALGGAAFVAFTPVTAENVTSRAALICRGYGLAARLGDGADPALAWGRHLDCSCVGERLQALQAEADVAALVEAYRLQGLKRAQNWLSGTPAEPATLPPEAEPVMPHLFPTIAMCQRPFG